MEDRERELAERTMKEIFEERGREEIARICGVSRPTTYQWRVCPPHHVLTLEAATGKPRSFIRPDLYPGKVFDIGGQ